MRLQLRRGHGDHWLQGRPFQRAEIWEGLEMRTLDIFGSGNPKELDLVRLFCKRVREFVDDSLEELSCLIGGHDPRAQQSIDLARNTSHDLMDGTLGIMLRKGNHPRKTLIQVTIWLFNIAMENPL